MLTENRDTTMLGLPVSETTAKKASKRQGQKPERIDPNLISGIRESTNAENKSMIEATNSLEIFNKNIDYSGKADVQQMVEFMAQIMDVPEDQRAGRAKQQAELYVANQMKSKMEAVHRQYTGGTAKNREKVSDWAKHYSRCSRWEAFFLFVWEGLQIVATLTPAQKSGSNFLGIKTYDLLRLSFLECLPEMGAFVSGIGCEYFAVDRGIKGMHKPTASASLPAKPKKRKTPPAKDCQAHKVAKTVVAAARSEKGWVALGEWANTWTPGMWLGMSDKEQYDYRNGRGQGGHWPEQIPENLRCNPGKNQCLLTKSCQQVVNIFYFRI